MKRRWGLVFGMALLLAGLALVWHGLPMPAQAAQVSTLPPQAPALPTPTGLISLTGVNGVADRAAVRIRSGPGLEYAVIGTLRRLMMIDIIGTNGFDPERPCTVNFAADLDMWVEVRWRGRDGWMARCTLTISGDLSKLPVNGVPVR